MKELSKIFLGGLIFLLIFFSATVFVKAASPGLDSDINSLGKNADNVGNLLSREDLRNAYLQQEWQKILNSTTFGKVLLGVHGFLSNVSPIFQVLLGINYQFSWKFILTFIFWLFFINVAIRLSELLLLFFKEDSKTKLLRFGLFLLIFVFFSSVRLSLGLAVLVVGAFSSDTDILTRLLYCVLIIVTILIISRYSRFVKFLAIKTRRNIEEGRKDAKIRELDRKVNQKGKDHGEKSIYTDDGKYGAAFLDEFGKAIKEDKDL